MTLRILHVLDHSIPMQSGYTFRTRAILREQRRMEWETFHLTSPKHTASSTPEEIVELTITATHYVTTGLLTRSLQIRPEADGRNAMSGRV